MAKHALQWTRKKPRAIERHPSTKGRNMKTYICLSFYSIAIALIAGCKSTIPSYSTCVEDISQGKQVEVEVRCVSFKRSDIISLSQTKDFKMVDAKLLLNLLQSGRGSVLFAPRIIGQAGMELQVKGTTEVIYPTDAIDLFPRQPEQSPSTNESAVSQINNPEKSGFETRETGIFVTLTTNLTPDKKQIYVTITEEIILEPTWHKHIIKTNDKTTEIQQPIFNSQNFRTSCKVQDGEVTLIGGGTPDTANDTLIYSLLTARILPSADKEKDKKPE